MHGHIARILVAAASAGTPVFAQQAEDVRRATDAERAGSAEGAVGAAGTDASAAGTDASAASAKIDVDATKRTVTIEAVVAKQNVYAQLDGAIEYILVAEGGKAYESLFVTRADPLALAQAFARIGLEKGACAVDRSPPRGMEVVISMEPVAASDAAVSEVATPEASTKRRRVDELVLRRTVDASGRPTFAPLEPKPWTFTGSRLVLDDDATPREASGAPRRVPECALTRSLIGLHFQDRSPLVQNPRPEAHAQNLYRADVKSLPEEGTRVRIVFERRAFEVAAGTVRAHLFIAGRVQGVGFRAFTQRSARQAKLVGWVMNREDGRVEAVIEGPKPQVDALVETLGKGPRSARVEKLERSDESPYGGYTDFAIFHEDS